MGNRLLIRAGLVAVCLLGGIAWAEDRNGPFYRTPSFFPSETADLPPYIFSDAAIQAADARPVESFFHFRFAKRTLKFKTSYFEKKFSPDPLSGENKRRRVLSVLGSSELVGELLKGESEFAYNPFTPGTMEGFGKPIAKLFRFRLAGKWNVDGYGAEFLSADKGFMNLKGSEARRSARTVRAWGEHGFGPVRVKATVAQLWENVDEDSNRPRMTKSALVSAKYTKSKWRTTLSSDYRTRRDDFSGGDTTAFLSHELKTLYRPVSGLSFSPRLKYAQKWNRTERIRTRSPSLSMVIDYRTWRDVLKIKGFVSYAWSRSSDGLTDTRDFKTTAKMLWNLGGLFRTRQSRLSFEISYKHRVDHIMRANSGGEFSTKLLLAVLSF